MFLDKFKDHVRFILSINRKPILVKKNVLYNPGSWHSAKDILELQKQHPGSEITFVISKNSGFFLIDLDDCLVGKKRFSPQAEEICSMFPGCYQEVSRDRQGLHIIGILPEVVLPPFRNKVASLGIEFYLYNRLVFMTGNGHTGDPHTVGYNLPGFIQKYISKEASVTPEPEKPAEDSLAVLIQKMRESKTPQSMLGHKASFDELWTANPVALGKVFPDIKNRAFDWSKADFALCAHLAFWTEKNPQKMDTLFRQSKLMREKWERDSYGLTTIEKAIESCKYTYEKYSIFKYPPGTWIEGELIKKIFSGIVYDTKGNNFYMPNGDTMSHTGFRNGKYAKYIYVIGRTKNDTAQTTGDVVKAFTNNKLFEFSKTHGVVFSPGEPGWRIIKDEEGRKKFNVYKKPDIEPVKGNISWFKDYLQRMCANDEDREIIKSYCIAMVQNPGVKFHWCLGLQGMQGTGKSAIVDLLEYMIGLKYSYRLRAVNLAAGKSFNAWMYQRILIEISEFEVAHAKAHFTQLRDYITGRRVDLELKNQDCVMAENVANFIITTNYKKALAPLWRERRLAPISLNIQTEEEREAAGLTSEYWISFYNRLKPKNGKPAMAVSNLYYWMLNTTPNAEYNPLGRKCRGKAPKTSFLPEAMEISRSEMAQAVFEVVENGSIPGFRGGVIFLSAFLRIGYPHLSNREKIDIVTELGYVQHPKFPPRFSCKVIEEGNVRPTVYLDKRNPLLNQTNRGIFQQTCIELQDYSSERT